MHKHTTHCAFSSLERAANEAATGNNCRPLPTPAQAVAGNYKMGRARVQGLDVRIENVRGSVRSGTSPDGKTWSSRMAAHYGYIAGTRGADGDAVDIFVGPFPESTLAWVINQGDAKGGFDEHKVMVGFATEAQARDGYLHSYDKGWRGLRSIVPLSIDQLKWWLRHGNKAVDITPDKLPHEGENTMDQVAWGADALPTSKPLSRLIYDMRLADEGGLLLDACTVDDLMTDPDIEGRAVMDAMVVEVGMLQRKMEQLLNVMKAAAATVQPVDFTIADPVKMRGTMQIAVVFAMNDGQAVTVWFHNPDTTPAKLTPMDELVSWKWMLNKKDVTIWAAPERGRDIPAREVARRVMKLADKNSEAFKRANARAADLAAQHAAIDAEISVLEAELAKLQDDVEVARIAKEDGEIVPLPHVEPAPEPSQPPEETRPAPGDGGLVDQIKALNAQRLALPEFIKVEGLAVEGYDDNVLGISGRRWKVTKDGADYRVGFPSKQEAIAFAESHVVENPERVALSDQIQALAIKMHERGATAPQSTGEANTEAFKPDPVVEPGEVVGEAAEAPAQIEADQPAVEIDVAPFNGIPEDRTGIVQMREIAMASLMAMRDEEFDCPALGAKVKLRMSGINKFKSFGTDPKKLKIAAGIGRLIGLARFVKREPNYDKARSPNIVAYHLLRAKARLGGEEYAVRFKVGEDDKGLYHWDCSVHEANAIFDAVQNGEEPTAVSSSISEGGNRGCTQNRSALPEPARLLPVEPSTEHRDGFILDDAGAVVNSRTVLNLFVEGDEPAVMGEEDAASPVSVVDDAYRFAQATDRFKEYIAETVADPDYSMFATAKAIDEAAKVRGASVSWDVEEVSAFDSVEGAIDAAAPVLDRLEAGVKLAAVGRIFSEGVLAGVATIGGDGKAMIYLGNLGGDRVKGPSGNPAAFGEDPENLVKWLLEPSAVAVPEPEPAPAAEDGNVAVLRSILAGESDAAHLSLTLATIEACVNALNDAGLLTGEVEQLAQDAITYWANLDEKVNG